jgi:peptidoglycan/xylan/chitin deacetylase (PgdA/CDA1 family)
MFTLVLALGAAADARAQTLVSLTFDDGIATQNLVRPMLLAHNMRGTFFINSGNVGLNGYYMTWADVDALAGDGDEIGGHTVDHQRLTDLTPDQQRHEICDDAATLRGRGYSITDFAYPYGAGSTDPNVRQDLLDCGYASARKFGDLYSVGCTDNSCPPSERVPPTNAYGIRTPEYYSGEYTLAELEGFVTQAENSGGGWVPIVFHDICDNCAGSSVKEATISAFLDWLQARATSATLVRTVHEVMTGPTPGFPRPKGASPLRVPLVIGSEKCLTPDKTHGAPLSYPSCTPERSSGQVTVGTPDTNGHAANSVGFVRLDVIAGNPATTADEADVALRVSITDVRKVSSPSTDYAGELAGEWTFRITDKLSGATQTEGATMRDAAFEFTVPCTATADTSIGGACALATTADTIVPGVVHEGARANWEIGEIDLNDGGPDGVASTPDNSRFAVQGVFVP